MKLITRKIRKSDLEIVLNWRNQDFVRNQMISNDFISFEEHVKWFDSLDNKLNHIFIYSMDKTDIGYMSCKITDLKKGIFDVSLYCGNLSYLGHPINFLSMIYIHDYTFRKLKLKKSITKIKNNNHSSININKKIGYIFHKKFNSQFDIYFLENQNFEKSRKKLNKLIKMIS